MVRVLYDYGYAVNPDGGDREQQFPCDLHGDGNDGKASGRLYPSSNSMYCFACGRARDAVSLAMEKEGVKFPDALDKLERRYGLPTLPDDGTDDADDPRETTLADVFADRPDSYETSVRRTERFLCILTTTRMLTLPETLQMWAEFNRVQHGVTKEGWPDSKAALEMDAIRHRAREAIYNE